MTDYKLVPTRDDLIQCLLATRGQSEGVTADAILSMLTAAPAVQGEPVAWLYEDELPDSYPYETMFPYSKVDGVRMFPVYAPQPAEQQPECGCCGQTVKCDDDCDAVVIGGHRAAELKPSVDDSPTPVPDELFAAEFAAWWDKHGQLCRAGGGDYERTFAFEAWRHLYPQLMSLRTKPAPDVTKLVEALDLALEYWRDRQRRYKNRRPKWVIAAESALAARRNQGEA